MSLLSAISVIAQTKKCPARIIDAETRKPLPFATIAIVSKSIGTITDVNGCFELKINSLSWKDSLEVSYVGYKSQKISLEKLQHISTIPLSPKSTMLSEVILESASFDILEFMKEVASVYQNNRRKTAHISKATYEQYGKYENEFVQYTLCSGYTVYFGDKEKVARLGLYTYVPEYVNKSFRRKEWLNSSKYSRKSKTDVVLMGSVGYNSYLFFEESGPLSQFTRKYKYKLDSIYTIGNEEVYKVMFNAKPTFDVSANFAKGYILVYANSKKLIRANVSGELLWSPVFHERVFGQMQYEYVYYFEQPFLYELHTYYKKQKIEERTMLHVELQKFDKLEVAVNDLFDIRTYAENPDIVPALELSKKSLLDIDFEILFKEWGFVETLSQQFKRNEGKKFWEYTSPYPPNNLQRRQNAKALMKKYQMFFY